MEFYSKENFREIPTPDTMEKRCCRLCGQYLKDRTYESSPYGGRRLASPITGKEFGKPRPVKTMLICGQCYDALSP